LVNELIGRPERNPSNWPHGGMNPTPTVARNRTVLPASL